MVAGELAAARIMMRQLQADLAEEGVNQVSVMVYNTGSRSPIFGTMQSVMTIITLTAIPRKLEPKGLYVACWVHGVNKQKKQVEFCNDQ